MQSGNHKGFRIAIGALTLCVCVCVGGRVYARGANEISIRIGQNFVGSGNLALFDTANLVQGELVYARRIIDLWRGQLWVEGAWRISATSGDVYDGVISSDMTVNDFTIGTRFTLPVLQVLRLYTRGGVGLTVAQLEIGSYSDDYSEEDPGKDRVLGVAGYGLVGVQLLLPPTWHSRLARVGIVPGFVIEGGVMAYANLNFDNVKPAQNDELLHTEINGINLGKLNLTAGTVRAGFVVMF